MEVRNAFSSKPIYSFFPARTTKLVDANRDYYLREVLHVDGGAHVGQW